MTFNARSNSGCWTCRLRKKKCDEDHPACSACHSLSLPCHGYGPRPDWMDGGSEEHKMAANFRGIVKVSNRQKRQHHGRQRGRAIDKQIVTSLVTVVESNLSRQPQSSSTASPISSRTSSTYHEPPTTLGSTLEDEQILLMHYLDHVFVLQFPFYEPTIKEGGRGWLLSILMRTKPLYYAALTLAAYHRQVSMCTVTQKTAKCTLDELLENHTLAMSELRGYLSGCGAGVISDSISHQVEVLASMTLLISLEATFGITEHWVMHLDAAISVMRSIRSDDIELLSAAYKTALKFFYSVIGWYDTLSCATIRHRAFSVPECLSARSNSLDSEKLMGCEDWVILHIREIASLESKRDLILRDGNFHKVDLVCAGENISVRLQDGLRRNLAFLQMSPKDSTSTDLVRSVVTRIFACSTLTYLYVTIHGAVPESAEICHSVRQTVNALEMLPNKDLIRNLTWPLCIAGSMALPEDRKFFKDLISTMSTTAKRLANTDKVLEIIEECWRMRDSQDCAPDGACWSSAMERLGLSILLV